MLVVTLGVLYSPLQTYFLSRNSGGVLHRQLEERILMLEQVKNLSNVTEPSKRDVSEVFLKWGLSEEGILTDTHNPDMYARLYYFIDALLKNLTTHEHMTKSSLNDLFALNQVLSQKPRANISLLVPSVVTDVKKIIPFLISILMQTVLPSETIMALAVPEQSEAELLTNTLANLGLPQFRIFLRGGTHRAGDNRVYLSTLSKYEVNSFFDCDDFMFPQRIELISRVFDLYPELESTLHGYIAGTETMFKDGRLIDYLSKYILTDNDIYNWTMKWDYADFWNQHPILHYNDSASNWIPDDPHTEPNHSPRISEHWYFGLGTSLTPPHRFGMHNGWVTFRKSILKFVPYPDLFYGEDSLFNWRTLKNKRNFTLIDYGLGVYLTK